MPPYLWDFLAYIEMEMEIRKNNQDDSICINHPNDDYERVKKKNNVRVIIFNL